MADLLMRGIPPGGLSGAIDVNRMRTRFGLILFDGYSLLLAGAVVEALHIAKRLTEDESSNRASYVVHVLSTTGGAVSGASSVLVKTAKCEESLLLSSYHAVFVAAATGDDHTRAHGGNIDSVRGVIELAAVVFPIGHEQRLLDLAGLNGCAHTLRAQ